MSETTTRTAATLSRHIEAVMSGNVDAVLENFTDDSIVFTPDGIVRGRAAIRKDTETFFATTPPEMMEALEIVRRDIDGEVAYLLWKAEPFVSLATETFVVRNGKIVAQTSAVLGSQSAAG